MSSLLSTIGWLGRPIALGLVVLIGLGIANSGSGAGKSITGLACHNATSDPGFNRMLCQLNPARVWNMPITELLPFLAPEQD